MELKFNTAGSDKLNWFSFPRLVDSPWTDIDTEPKNVFSIQGLDGRNFFINRNYGGCNVDAGWLVVTSPDTHCNWETRFLPRKNVVIYSKLSGKTTWSDYSKSTGCLALQSIIAAYHSGAAGREPGSKRNGV